MKDDAYWMRRALGKAHLAARRGEVPVGAVLVKDGRQVASAHNSPISRLDPSAHAELLCLRLAAKKLKNYRLTGTTLYATLEPCAMCAGAFVWARVGRVVFGAWDEKSGALGSVVSLNRVKKFNHRFEAKGGVLEPECRELLQDFFRARRPFRRASGTVGGGKTRRRPLRPLRRRKK